MRCPASGGDEHLQSASGEVVHLFVMPVAGVGEHHPWQPGFSDRVELSQRGLHQRLQQPEVRRVVGQLGRDHDLPGVDGGLGVVALDEALGDLDRL